MLEIVPDRVLTSRLKRFHSRLNITEPPKAPLDEGSNRVGQAAREFSPPEGSPVDALVPRFWPELGEERPAINGEYMAGHKRRTV